VTKSAAQPIAPYEAPPPAELAQIAREAAHELALCTDLLLETQECISELVPLVQSTKTVTGLQRIDLATQSVECLARVLLALSKNLPKGQVLSLKDVEGGPLLHNIEERLWADPLEVIPPSTPRSTGTVELF